MPQRKLQAHAFKAVMSYQVETSAFLKHRCEQDVKLMDDLAASDQFNDAFDVVSNFVQNATSEYSTEAGKIALLGSRLASETAQRMRKEAKDNYRGDGVTNCCVSRRRAQPAAPTSDRIDRP